MYSLIKPRKKHILRNDTKLWIFFTLLLFFFFMIMNLLILGQVYSFDQRKTSFIQQIKVLEADINSTIEHIQFVEQQQKLGESVYGRNIVLKDSLENLFNLVPDQIYLTKAVIDTNSLEIHGFTPSKDTYNFLLKPPLKSIFNRSEVVFYPYENGWFKFVSINYSQEEYLYEKE